MLEINFNPFPILDTDRLILRSLETGDDENLFFLRSDIGVNKYLEGFKHDSLEQTQAFIEKILNGIVNNEWIFWVIILKDSNQFIGTICLWNISKEQEKAETGYVLHPNYQGKGYMKESLYKVINFGFENMGLKTVEAFTHKDNENSRKLLLKSKFWQDENRKVEDGSMDIVFVLNKE